MREWEIEIDMYIVLLSSEEILFILDGLDECKRKDSVLVNKLLEVHSRFNHVYLNRMVSHEAWRAFVYTDVHFSRLAVTSRPPCPTFISDYSESFIILSKSPL